MITKKINLSISVTSKVLKVIITYYFAILVAYIFWWIFQPSATIVYMQRPSYNHYNDIAKFIINRHPFGVMINPIAPSKPQIINLIKLTGVYATDQNNSIAFIEYESKSLILKIGNKINSTTSITKITPQNVTIVENGNSSVITLSRGDSSASANTIPMNPTFRNNNPTSNNYGYPQSNNYQPPQQPNNTTNAVMPNSREFFEQRNKILEELSKQSNSTSNKTPPY